MTRPSRGAQSHWRVDGRPKQGMTRAEAAEMSEQLQREQVDAGVVFSRVSCYECPTCGEWHIGNLRATDTGPRRQKRSR